MMWTIFTPRFYADSGRPTTNFARYGCHIDIAFLGWSIDAAALGLPLVVSARAGEAIRNSWQALRSRGVLAACFVFSLVTCCIFPSNLIPRNAGGAYLFAVDRAPRWSDLTGTMRPELPVLSFLCMVLLTGLAPLHIQARNVATVALIMWLLLCNIIQGVNSLVWSDSATVRSPVWCDISTKVLLGARIALPAATACTSIHLFSLAANYDPRKRYHRLLFEVTLCFVIPLIYMALHIIVQSHRFDLAADFGCSPSLYISAPAIILIWMPPIILCIITFVFSALATWRHTRRNPLITDRAGLSPRIVTITFLRPLFMATSICILLLSVSIIDLHDRLLTTHGLLPWTSWTHVHAELAKIDIVDTSSTSDLSRIQAFWWFIPISTLIFVIMAFIGVISWVQQDSYGRKSVGRWFRSTVFRRPGSSDTFIQSSPTLVSRITIQSPTPPLPIHLNSTRNDSLKSGRTGKQRPLLYVTPSQPLPGSDLESDASFKASTLSYLESPTGREATGFPLPLIKSTLHPPQKLRAPPTASSNTQLDQTTGISASTTHSILSSPWPVPPSVVPVTPTRPDPSFSLSPKASSSHLRSPSELSLTTSLASSTISTNAYLPDPDIYLHNVSASSHRPPFQDAGMPVSTTAVAHHPRRVPSRDALLPRSLSSGVKRLAGRRRDLDGPGEAIYMTVVHETQAY